MIALTRRPGLEHFEWLPSPDKAVCPNKTCKEFAFYEKCYDKCTFASCKAYQKYRARVFRELGN